jgi:hypothetical protein
MGLFGEVLTWWLAAKEQGRKSLQQQGGYIIVVMSNNFGNRTPEMAPERNLKSNPPVESQ